MLILFLFETSSTFDEQIQEKMIISTSWRTFSQIFFNISTILGDMQPKAEVMENCGKKIKFH